jgi:ABC-type transport system involved in multi-copper enzyme maturation permease subunit
MIKTIWFKEVREQLYTWKGLSWLFLTSFILSVTIFLLLTNVELNLLDQSEMLWLISKILIGASLLFITVDAASIISSEFEKGTIETLFLAPLNLKQLILGKFLSSLTLWLALFLLALPYLLVASAGGELTFSLIAYLGLFSLLLIASFTMISFGIALFSRSTKVSISISLGILLIFFLPALSSSALKTSPLSTILGVLNPIDATFSSLDNILVDFHTSLLQNANYLFTLLGFLAVTFIFLFIAIINFGKRGVIKNE